LPGYVIEEAPFDLLLFHRRTPCCLYAVITAIIRNGYEPAQLEIEDRPPSVNMSR